MHVGVKQSMTAATALLAAGAIAIGPAIGPVSAQAPEALRAAHVADINLMASPDPIAALEGFTESGLRLVQAIAQLPLAAVAASLAIADGDPQAFYNSIRQVIDAPLWVIDPALGIDQTSLSGGGLAALFPDQAGDIQAFRNNVLWAATNQFRSSIADLLGVADTSTPLDVLTPLAGFAAGVADSAYRLAEGLVLAPFGPLSAILEIASGVEPNVAVYNMLNNYISAPLWVADSFMGTGPTQQAFPIGLKALLPNRADGIQDFRNDVLWKATNSVREVVREALGVPASANPNNPTTLDAGARAALDTVDVAKVPAASPTVTLDVVTAPPAVEKQEPKPKATNRVLGSVNLGKYTPGEKNAEGASEKAGADGWDGVAKQANKVDKRLGDAVQKLTKPKVEKAATASTTDESANKKSDDNG